MTVLGKRGGKRRTRTGGALAVALLGTVLTAAVLAGGISAAPASPSQHNAKLTVVRAAWVNNAPGAIIVEAQKFAKKFGIDLKLTEFQRYPDVRTAVAAGQIDIGLADPTGMVILAGQKQNSDVTVMDGTKGGDDIVVRKGVTASSLASLKGKKIAAGIGGGDYVLFESLLTQLKMKDGQFQLVNFQSPADAVSLLKGGQVDAAILWQPFVQTLVDGNVGYISPKVNLASQPLGDLNSVIIANRGFAQNKAAALVNTLRAIIEAGNTLSKNHALWAKILAGFGSGGGEALLKKSVSGVTFTPGLSLSVLQTMSAVESRLGLAKPATMSDYVDVSYLAEAMGILR